MVASGVRPSSFALASDMITTAAAPSLMPDALPAVTVPPSVLKAGPQRLQLLGRRAGPRVLVGVELEGLALLRARNLDRHDLGLELAALDGRDRLAAGSRPRTRPAPRARCSYLAATFSAVMPMCTWVIGQVRPSAIIESSSCSCPIRMPKRAFFEMYGAPLMLSIPPATTMSASPSMIACAARTTALSPEPHALLTREGRLLLRQPALEGRDPRRIQPETGRQHVPEDDLVDLLGRRASARRMASRTAMAPSLVAGCWASAPPSVPMAVRVALTMTALAMTVPPCRE